MTIEKLYQYLSAFLEKIYDADIFDDAVRELEILVTRLRITMVSGIFEPQKPLTCRYSDLENLLMTADVPGGDPNGETECCKMIREVVLNTRRVLNKEGMVF